MTGSAPDGKTLKKIVPWIFGAPAGDKHTQDIQHAIYELGDQSDRAATIVASSILDLILTSALKRFLYDKPKVANELFSITGPSATLAPRSIWLCLSNLLTKRFTEIS